MRRALKLVSQGAVWSHNPNRNVFSDRLNCPRLSHRLKLSGSVFHRRGPAAAKHRSPKGPNNDHKRLPQSLYETIGIMACN